jgi:hypothetical protein
MKTASPEEESRLVKRGLLPSSRVTEPVGVPVVVLATWTVRLTVDPVVPVATKLLSVMTVPAGVMVRAVEGAAMV